MAHWFPKLYTNETFYSACARYASQASYGSYSKIMEDLFGISTAHVRTDFPSHLQAFLQRLPSGHEFTVDRLIDHHTLLPFYRPFLPRKTSRRIRSIMIDSPRGISVDALLGIMPLRISPLEFLRYCPICIGEDRDRYGESFWHREHQVPGITACAVHAVWLETSIVGSRFPQTKQQLISADKAATVFAPRTLDTSDEYHGLILKLAKDAAWLLRNPHLPPKPRKLRQKHIAELTLIGLSNYRGRIRERMLLTCIRKTFCHRILVELKCSLTEPQRSNPLLRTIRSSDPMQHPLHHLLLIYFLGHSAESFWNAPIQPRFFGTGPWPCLNPFSHHRHQPTIRSYSISFDQKTGYPVALFRCRCGFVYRRQGPDWGPLAMFSGLKVGKNSTHKCTESMPNSSMPPSSLKAVDKAKEPTVLQNKRDAWLDALRQHGITPNRTVRQCVPKLYSWLYRHDRQWLLLHRPAYRHRAPSLSTSTVDWSTRDQEAVKRLRIAHSTLAGQKSRPVRIYLARLARVAGVAALIPRALKHLPRCQELIHQLIPSDTTTAQTVKMNSNPTSHLAATHWDECEPDKSE